MVRVFAHEVHGGQVELALARRAARDLEDPRRVRIRQLLDLFPLLGRFGSVRRDEGLVLPLGQKVSRGGSEPEQRPKCARTHRLGVLLVGEELPLEVFANESEARRVVLAQELHDLDRRHDPPLVDLVEDLNHIGLMPREELGRTRQV